MSSHDELSSVNILQTLIIDNEYVLKDFILPHAVKMGILEIIFNILSDDCLGNSCTGLFCNTNHKPCQANISFSS